MVNWVQEACSEGLWSHPAPAPPLQPPLLRTWLSPASWFLGVPSHRSLASALHSGKEVGSAIWEAHPMGLSDGCTTSPSLGA